MRSAIPCAYTSSYERTYLYLKNVREHKPYPAFALCMTDNKLNTYVNVAYAFVFLGNIIICRLQKLTFSDKAQATL